MYFTEAIVSLVLVCACINAAPAVVPVSVKVKDAISRTPKYSGTLLNSTVLPSLNDCDTSESEGLCLAYLEMVSQLNASNSAVLVTPESVEQALTMYGPENIKEFCSKFPENVVKSHYYPPHEVDFYQRISDKIACNVVCGKFNGKDVSIRPMCQLISIGYDFLNDMWATKATTNNATTVQNVGANKSMTSTATKPHVSQAQQPPLVPTSHIEMIQPAGHSPFDHDIRTTNLDALRKAAPSDQAAIPAPKNDAPQQIQISPKHLVPPPNDAQSPSNQAHGREHEIPASGPVDSIPSIPIQAAAAAPPPPPPPPKQVAQPRRPTLISAPNAPVSVKDHTTNVANAHVPSDIAPSTNVHSIDVKTPNVPLKPPAEPQIPSNNEGSAKIPTAEMQSPPVPPVEEFIIANESGSNEDQKNDVANYGTDDRSDDYGPDLNGDQKIVNVDDNLGGSEPNQLLPNNDKPSDILQQTPDVAEKPVDIHRQPEILHKPGLSEPSTIEVGDSDVVVPDPFVGDADSNFFTYFMFLLLICVIVYVGYHNKSKVLALLLEGRRSSTSSGRGGIGRRKHTAAYRKLDTNLEEAISSNTSGRTQQIIY